MRILKMLLVFPLLLALCACASGGETAQKEKPAAPAQAVLSGSAKAADAPKPSAPSPDVLDFHLQAMPEEEYISLVLTLRFTESYPLMNDHSAFSSR